MRVKKILKKKKKKKEPAKMNKKGVRKNELAESPSRPQYTLTNKL